MAEITYLEAIREALFEEMERDKNVFMIGEDIGAFGGAFKVTEGLMKKYGEDKGRRLAAAIAFYGFFSIFPLMLVLVAVLGLVLHDNDDLRDRIRDTALAQFPVIGTDIQANVGTASGSFDEPSS